MGPDPFYPVVFDGSAWQGLRRGFAVIQDNAGAFVPGIPQADNIRIRSGSFTLSYELTAADVAAQLSIGWNAWGAFGDSLTAGTNHLVISVDDMLVTRPTGPFVDTAAPSGYFTEGEAGTVTVEVTGLRLEEGTVDFASAGVVTDLPTSITPSGTFTVAADGTGTGTLTLTGTAADAGTSTVTITMLGTTATFDLEVRPGGVRGVVFDLQELTEAEALAHFAGRNAGGRTGLDTRDEDGDLVVYAYLEIVTGEGIHDSAGWNWSPLTIVRPGQSGLFAGDVLEMTVELSHTGGGNFGMSHLGNPVNWRPAFQSPDAYTLTFTLPLTADDITNGLEIRFNLWGGLAVPLPDDFTISITSLTITAD